MKIAQCDVKALFNKMTTDSSDFYKYKIVERDGKECSLLLFRNLLNQFLVDMFAKIEAERLYYFRHNKEKNEN